MTNGQGQSATSAQNSAATRGNNRSKVWVRPVLLLASIAATLILATVFLDFYIIGRHKGIAITQLLTGIRASDAQQMVGGLAEVVVALLGIIITVASIIVQLAATRYTPRITEMYITDKTNLAFLAFFVVTAVFCIWVSFSIRGGAGHFFVPVSGVLVLYAFIGISILLMTPYFSYVFSFLDPQKVVSRIKEQTIAKARRVEGGDGHRVEWGQKGILDGIEQLADVALNTLEHKDKIIASRSVDVLHELGIEYIRYKKNLPVQWFHVGRTVRQDPDFVPMSKDRLGEMSKQRTWVEYKILRQFQMIYNEALNKMRDLNYLLAIDTRYIGQAAIKAKDTDALNLCIKFFNTYLRATLNARDVRTAYNIFNQYRQLSEEIVKAEEADLAVEVGGYFKYYAQVAFAMQLSFVTETVAYDLCTLIELAHAAKSPCLNRLVEIILEVDKEAEEEVQETSLRGVRKAQIKLATYFLIHGEEDLARRIYEDMKDEKPDRLRSIRSELLRIDTKDFWEIIDRGENFDYLEPPRKERLKEYFSWFPEETLRGPGND